MSRYIDADALLKEWKIELPKKRPVKGEHSEEFIDFMKRYENHPYYFAILSLYLAEPAGVCEVVRCKDCMHRIINENYGKRGYMMNLKAVCAKDTGDPFELGRHAEEDEWFCADAERKTK